MGLVSSLVSSWKKDPARLSIFRISSSLFRFRSGSVEGGTGRGLLQRKSRRWRARLTVSLLRSRPRSLNSRSMRREQLHRERNRPCSLGAFHLRPTSRSVCAPPRPRALLDVAFCDRGRLPVPLSRNVRRPRTRWFGNRKVRERSGWGNDHLRRATRCASSTYGWVFSRVSSYGRDPCALRGRRRYSAWAVVSVVV